MMMKTDSITIVLAYIGSLMLLCGCRAPVQPNPTPPSLEYWIAILKAADPALPDWEHADFVFATSQLAKMGPAAAPAAPALARALQYPRRDSYMAGQALVAIGPAAQTALPELMQALKNDRPEVRSIALYILGIIGEPAQCAVPEIASLLWDSKSSVRITAAMALDAITGKDLVEGIYEIDPARLSIPGEPPPGKPYDDSPIISKARAWWIEEGQFLNWSGKSNLCNPSRP